MEESFLQTMSQKAPPKLSNLSDTYVMNYQVSLKEPLFKSIPKSSSECLDNIEYVKSLKCDKKNRSYGIIAIQPQTQKLYEIIDGFLSNIKKSLYVHNSKSCRKIIHLASFTICKENLKFLMLTKKYSYGFYDFIHNKFNSNNNIQINKLLNEMTSYEINCIMTKSYKELWAMIHKHQPCPVRYEKIFNKIIKNIKSKFYNISPNRYITPEWEFPKGKKKNDNETDIEAAKREFKEETNLTDEDFTVYDNIKPIVENYTGTDGFYYSYFYFIALIKPSIKIKVDKTFETDKIGFYSYDTAFTNIRPYNAERKQILKCVFDDIVNWINKKCNITLSNGFPFINY